MSARLSGDIRDSRVDNGGGAVSCFNSSTVVLLRFFFFSSRRRHTRLQGDWSSDVCSSDLFVWCQGFPPERLETPRIWHTYQRFRLLCSCHLDGHPATR